MTGDRLKLGSYSEGLIEKTEIERAATGWNARACGGAVFALLAGATLAAIGYSSADLETVSEELYAACIGGLLALAAIVPAGYGILANRPATRINDRRILTSGWLGYFSAAYVLALLAGLVIGLMGLLYSAGWEAPILVGLTLTVAAWSPLILFWLSDRLTSGSSAAYVVAEVARSEDDEASRSLLKDLRDIALTEKEQPDRRAVKARLRGLATAATVTNTEIGVLAVDELGFVLSEMVGDRDLSLYGLDILAHAHRSLSGEPRREAAKQAAEIWAVGLEGGASDRVKQFARDLLLDAADDTGIADGMAATLQPVVDAAREHVDQVTLPYIRRVAFRALESHAGGERLVRLLIDVLAMGDAETARDGARQIVTCAIPGLLSTALGVASASLEQRHGSDDPTAVPGDSLPVVLAALMTYPTMALSIRSYPAGVDIDEVRRESAELALAWMTARHVQGQLRKAYPLVAAHIAEAFYTSADQLRQETEGTPPDELSSSQRPRAQLLVRLARYLLGADLKEEGPTSAWVVDRLCRNITEMTVTEQWQPLDHPLHGVGIRRQLAGLIQRTWGAAESDGRSRCGRRAADLLPLLTSTSSDPERSFAMAWTSFLWRRHREELEQAIGALDAARQRGLYLHLLELEDHLSTEKMGEAQGDPLNGVSLPGAAVLVPSDDFLDGETDRTFHEAAGGIRAFLSAHGDAEVGALEALLELEIGSVWREPVAWVEDYGAFLEINGVNSLLHYTEMDLPPGRRVDTFIERDDVVEVAILRKDPRAMHLNLSQRTLTWPRFLDQVTEGDTIEVVLVGVEKWRAWGRTPQGPVGEIPIDDVHTTGGETLENLLVEGDRVEVVVKQIHEAERSIELSMADAGWNRLLDQVEVGDIIDVTVANVVDFGVFVRTTMGPIGLIHRSEIELEPGTCHQDMLQVGDPLRARIDTIQPEERRISLSTRSTPWQHFVENTSIGQIIEVTIRGIASFGAFGRTKWGVDGLIHVSELSDGWVEHPSSVVEVGDTVPVMVLDIDEEEEQIRLSLKATKRLA